MAKLHLLGPQEVSAGCVVTAHIRPFEALPEPAGQGGEGESSRRSDSHVHPAQCITPCTKHGRGCESCCEGQGQTQGQGQGSGGEGPQRPRTGLAESSVRPPPAPKGTS